jgi:hypothetical protein
MKRKRVEVEVSETTKVQHWKESKVLQRKIKSTNGDLDMAIKLFENKRYTNTLKHLLELNIAFFEKRLGGTYHNLGEWGGGSGVTHATEETTKNMIDLAKSGQFFSVNGQSDHCTPFSRQKSYIYGFMTRNTAKIILPKLCNDERIYIATSYAHDGDFKTFHGIPTIELEHGVCFGLTQNLNHSTQTWTSCTRLHLSNIGDYFTDSHTRRNTIINDVLDDMVFVCIVTRSFGIGLADAILLEYIKSNI